MARPRVFISSTFYDLKQTREDLASFITEMGYEAVRNEEGNIPYGNRETLDKYCYREIQNIDIFVSIIGGRYGSTSSESQWSISQEELKKAIQEKKQVYIFILSNVASEYETYLINKGSDTKYKHVDNIKIYEFIEDIKNLTSNNNIKEFSSFSEIQHYLKEQFAGLFQSFLGQQSRVRDLDLATKLEKTANTLEMLVDYFKETEKGNTAAVTSLLKSTHPLVTKLTELLGIRYGFWIENFEMLKSFMQVQNWEFNGTSDDSSSENNYIWEKQSQKIILSKEVFEENGDLKDIRLSDWKEDYLRIIEKPDNYSTITPPPSEFDLPF